MAALAVSADGSSPHQQAQDQGSPDSPGTPGTISAAAAADSAAKAPAASAGGPPKPKVKKRKGQSEEEYLVQKEQYELTGPVILTSNVRMHPL